MDLEYRFVPVHLCFLAARASSRAFDIDPSRRFLVHRPRLAPSAAGGCTSNNTTDQPRKIIADHVHVSSDGSDALWDNCQLDGFLNDFIAGYNVSIFSLDTRDPILLSSPAVLEALARLRRRLPAISSSKSSSSASPPSYRLRFAVLGVTDSRCIDLVSEKPLQLSLVHSRFDSLFRPLDSIDELIELTERPISMPYFIVLRLESDSACSTLCLCDLGWSSDSLEFNDKVFNVAPKLPRSLDSFSALLDVLTSRPINVPFSSTDCFLTLLSLEFLVGNRRVLWLQHISPDSPSAFHFAKLAEKLRFLRNLYSKSVSATRVFRIADALERANTDIAQLRVSSAALSERLEKSSHTCEVLRFTAAAYAAELSACQKANISLKTAHESLRDTLASSHDLDTLRLAQSTVEHALREAQAAIDAACSAKACSAQLSPNNEAKLEAKISISNDKDPLSKSSSKSNDSLKNVNDSSTSLVFDSMRLRIERDCAASDSDFFKLRNAGLLSDLQKVESELNTARSRLQLLDLERTSHLSTLERYRTRIAELQSHISELQSAAEERERSLEAQLGEFEAANEELSNTCAAELTRNAAEIADLEHKLALMQAELDASGKRAKELVSDLKTLRTERDSLTANEADLRSQIGAIGGRAAADADARVRQELARSAAERDALLRAKSELASELAREQANAASVAATSIALRQELESLRSSESSASRRLRQADVDRGVLETALVRHDGEKVELTRTVEKLNEMVTVLNHQLQASVANLSEARSTTDALRVENEALKQDFQSGSSVWDSKERSFQAQIAALRRRNEMLSNSCTELTARLNDLQTSPLGSPVIPPMFTPSKILKDERNLQNHHSTSGKQNSFAVSSKDSFFSRTSANVKSLQAFINSREPEWSGPSKVVSENGISSAHKIQNGSKGGKSYFPLSSEPDQNENSKSTSSLPNVQPSNRRPRGSSFLSSDDAAPLNQKSKLSKSKRFDSDESDDDHLQRLLDQCSDEDLNSTRNSRAAVTRSSGGTGRGKSAGNKTPKQKNVKESKNQENFASGANSASSKKEMPPPTTAKRGRPRKDANTTLQGKVSRARSPLALESDASVGSVRNSKRKTNGLFVDTSYSRTGRKPESELGSFDSSSIISNVHDASKRARLASSPISSALESSAIGGDKSLAASVVDIGSTALHGLRRIRRFTRAPSTFSMSASSPTKRLDTALENLKTPFNTFAALRSTLSAVEDDKKD